MGVGDGHNIGVRLTTNDAHPDFLLLHLLARGFDAVEVFQEPLYPVHINTSCTD